MNVQWSDLLFLALAARALGQRFSLGWSPANYLVLIYLASSLLSLSGTAELRAGMGQYAKELYLVAVYAVFASFARRALAPERIAASLVVIAGVLSALCLLAVGAYALFGFTVPRFGVVMPLPYLGPFYRLYGTFSSPEYLVNFLTCVTPLALTRALASKRGRVFWSMAVFAIVAAACATIGHGIAGLVFAATASTARFWRPRHRVLAAIAFGVAVGLVLVVNVLLVVAVREVQVVNSRNLSTPPAPYPYVAREDRAGAPSIRVEVTYNVMAYWLLKRVAIEAFLHRPWIGVGLGAFHGETERAVSRGVLPSDYREHDPHSTWFGRLAETGLVGTLALAGLWVGIFRCAARAAGSPDGATTTAFADGLLGVLINSINVDVMNFRFVWLAFGVLSGVAADS